MTIPTHKLVALLPMKGHSARVPGKNFKPFAGKPLVRWILDTLLEVPEIDLVVINTDARSTLEDMGIGELPRVRIRDRRAEICGDFVSMNLVIADDIEAISSDVYLMTHTTNPLLGGSTIRAAVAAFAAARNEGQADSLFAVNKFQTRFYGQDGRAINHDPANLIRTQDLEPWYEENSNLYLFTGGSFQATKARIGMKPMMFETPRSESADIDDIDGWQIAEALAQAKLRGMK
jgi:CMP-N-acetylneuraminic acid synthetase